MSFTTVKIKYLHFPGVSHLPLLKSDIIPMSSDHEQPWVSLFHELFIFLGGLVRHKVPPLHFNLGNSSLPHHEFSLVDDVEWFN